MPSPPRVGVVLLNWNTVEYTLPCLASLANSVPQPDHILLIDNASTGDDVEEIRSQYPDVAILENKENLGFAVANNQGFDWMIQQGMDLIWVLNNDTEVAPDCLAQMLKVLEDPTIDVATGKMLYHEPPDHIWYAGGDISKWTLEPRHALINQPNSDSDPGNDRARDVSFVTGCSFLARTTVIQTIGGFHPDYFAYCEDVEWSLRAKAADLRLHYTPQAKLWHKVSASTKKNTLGSGGSGGDVSAFAHYLLARNRKFTIHLHGRGLPGIVAHLRYTAFHLYLLVGLTAKRRWPKIRSLRKGIREGKRGIKSLRK